MEPHLEIKTTIHGISQLTFIVRGLDIHPPRPRVDGEGQSLYFHDYDNHLFELHTGTLDERLTRYRRRLGAET